MKTRYGAGSIFLATDDASVVQQARAMQGLHVMHV
jgi:hypothetical protein